MNTDPRDGTGRPVITRTKIIFRNKIQKVFVMLNEVEPPETDQIESAAETLISKQSINFNDNPPAQIAAAQPSK